MKIAGLRVEVAFRTLPRLDPGVLLLRRMAADGVTFAAGNRIDGYVVDGVVGDGAAATIYRAVDEHIGASVVLKVPHSSVLSDGELRRRFRREARLTAIPINHSRVQRNLDDGRHRSAPYLVLSYVDGHNLRTELDLLGGTAPPDVVADWAAQLSTILAAVHDANILHRDVKPENIIIDSTGSLHLIDFGDATRLDRTGGRFHILSGIQGTAEYLSPEQIIGRPLDARSDLYGLGVVLYEALTGRPPFEAANSFDTLNAHLRDVPVDLRSTCGDIPPWLAAVVHGLLRRRPEERPGDARSLRASLDARVDHIGPPLADPPLRGSASSATARALARFVVVVAVSFIGVSAAVIMLASLLS